MTIKKYYVLERPKTRDPESVDKIHQTKPVHVRDDQNMKQNQKAILVVKRRCLKALREFRCHLAIDFY